MAAHPGDSPHVVSQRPDLQRLRHREPETEAGTHMDLPNCGPGMTGTCALCHQPQKPDHARRPKPEWAGSGGKGSKGAPASRQGDCGIVPLQKVPPLPRGA